MNSNYRTNFTIKCNENFMALKIRSKQQQKKSTVASSQYRYRVELIYLHKEK